MPCACVADGVCDKAPALTQWYKYVQQINLRRSLNQLPISPTPSLFRHRARHTIQDFVLSYLPYHGLSLVDFLKWWDVLVWVEGTIYAMDEGNEELTADMLGSEPGNGGVVQVDPSHQGKKGDNLTICEPPDPPWIYYGMQCYVKPWTPPSLLLQLSAAPPLSSV